MAFEKFTHKKSRGVLKPSVSISNVGLFILNSGCMAEHFKEIDYAELYWDKQNQKIGIKPMRKKPQHGYTVNKNESIGTLSGSGFLAHYGLTESLKPAKKEKPKSYDAKWNDELGLFEFSVKEKVVSEV